MATLLEIIFLLISLGLASPAAAQLIRSEMIEPEVIDRSGYGCTSAVGTDSYACATPVPFTAYVTGAHYWLKADVANTGAATVQFNLISGPKTIKKASGGVSTDLDTNDIRVGQIVDLVYDGTNMQLQSVLGNAASGAGLVYSTQSNTYSAGTTQDCGACTAEIMPKAAGANPTTSGSYAYDTTSDTFEWGENGTNRQAAAVNKAQTFTASQRFDDILELDDNSPAQINADQNNYNPGTKVVWRFSTDAQRTFTGFTGGGNYRFALLINVGSFNIILAHESNASTSTNRIINQTGANLTVAPNDIVLLVYDTSNSGGARWRTTLPRATAVEVDTLLSVFNRGKVISGANSFANAFVVGDGTNRIAFYGDSTNGGVIACMPASGLENDCDHVVKLKTGKKLSIKNNAGTEIASITEAGVTTGFGNVMAVATRAYHNTSQNINDDTSTIALLNDESWDTNNLHSTSSQTSRITLDAARTCFVSGNMEFSYDIGYRQISIILNGGAVIAWQGAPAATDYFSTKISTATSWVFAQGDYVELEGYQYSGSTLSISAANLSLLCY